MSSSETLLPAALTGTKRHYRVALSNSNERGREVVLKSFLTLGELYELIGVEDVVTGDDAYIQPIREEICGRGVYQGQYAQRLGLVHIASRRVNEQSNDLLYRHTGAKRTYNGYVLDGNGNRMYYPRQYIVRMVSDEERALDKEKKVTNRKKVLNTLAKVRQQFLLVVSFGSILSFRCSRCSHLIMWCFFPTSPPPLFLGFKILMEANPAT